MSSPNVPLTPRGKKDLGNTVKTVLQFIVQEDGDSKQRKLDALEASLGTALTSLAESLKLKRGPIKSPLFPAVSKEQANLESSKPNEPAVSGGPGGSSKPGPETDDKSEIDSDELDELGPTTPPGSKRKPGSKTARNQISRNTKKPTTKSKKGKGARTKSVPLQQDFSPTVTAAGMAQLREEFIEKLEEIEVSGRSLDQEDIEELAEYFFGQVFGQTTFDRLSSLYTTLINRNDEMNIDDDDLLTTRAMTLASNAGLPDTFREFFREFSILTSTKKNESSTVKLILNNFHRYRFYWRYSLLQLDARDNYDDFTKLVMEYNQSDMCRTQVDLEQRQGAGRTTIVINYLASCLGMERERLSTRLQEARPINLLVAIFGRGILPLLPKGAANTLNRIGTTKLEAVVPILRETLGADANEICRAAKKYLLKSIVYGVITPELGLAKVRNAVTGKKWSMLEALQPVDPNLTFYDDNFSDSEASDSGSRRYHRVLREEAAQGFVETNTDNETKDDASKQDDPEEVEDEEGVEGEGGESESESQSEFGSEYTA